MRILFEEIRKIVEFNEINLNKKWDESNNSKETPDNIELFLDGKFVGSRSFYEVRDKEKAKEILIDIDNVLERLLINGYCKATDFHDFRWANYPIIFEDMGEIIDINEDDKE